MKGTWACSLVHNGARQQASLSFESCPDTMTAILTDVFGPDIGIAFKKATTLKFVEAQHRAATLIASRKIQNAFGENRWKEIGTATLLP